MGLERQKDTPPPPKKIILGYRNTLKQYQQQKSLVNMYLVWNNQFEGFSNFQTGEDQLDVIKMISLCD